MKNTTKFLITVRFPSWGENNQYPAFGVKYLIDMPNDLLRNEEEMTIDPAETYFKGKYKEIIGRGEKEFLGDILFIEEVEYVIL